jgi:hypothetical protein
MMPRHHDFDIARRNRGQGVVRISDANQKQRV